MRASSCAQQGVALIVALVMLAVIGLSSVALMRGGLNADVQAQGARLQNAALQAAQRGLRYCEAQIELPESVRAIVLHPAPTVESPQFLWTDFANWVGERAKAVAVPEQAPGVSAAAITPVNTPQCLVEATGIAGGQSYIVTARGFSPDFSADSRGRTKTGAVVWLQSTVALGSTSLP